MLIDKLLASALALGGGAWLAVESMDVLRRWAFALHAYAGLADHVAAWGN